jgi:hypothetical protein
MKRLNAALGVAALVLAIAPAAPSLAGPVGKPDLVITTFGLTSWGNSCKPGATMFTFAMTVKNQSAYPMPAAEVVVLVTDLKSSGSTKWETGTGNSQALAPGQTMTLIAPMAYFTPNPGFMTTGAPHPFRAVVNPNHTIPESNYANNVAKGPKMYAGSPVIMVGAPTACKK